MFVRRDNVGNNLIRISALVLTFRYFARTDWTIVIVWTTGGQELSCFERDERAAIWSVHHVPQPRFCRWNGFVQWKKRSTRSAGLVRSGERGREFAVFSRMVGHLGYRADAIWFGQGSAFCGLHFGVEVPGWGADNGVAGGHCLHNLLHTYVVQQSICTP